MLFLIAFGVQRECGPLPFRLPGLTVVCHNFSRSLCDQVLFGLWKLLVATAFIFSGGHRSTGLVPGTALRCSQGDRECRPLPFRLPAFCSECSGASSHDLLDTFGGSFGEWRPLPFRLPPVLLPCVQALQCSSSLGFIVQWFALLVCFCCPTKGVWLLCATAAAALTYAGGYSFVSTVTAYRELGPLPFRLPGFCTFMPMQLPLIPTSGRTKHRGSRSSCWPCPSWLLMATWIFAQNLRFGEALNPGPAQDLLIGTCNAGGVLHKSGILADLPKGIWGITETHLTHKGLAKPRTDLKHRGVSARIIPGAPAPPLTGNPLCVGGKCTGVGFMSQFPIRAMPTDFDTDRWHSGRLQVSAAYVSGIWIKLGIAYGYSANNKNIETMQRTDDLLAELTNRVVRQSHGPRVLLGDFNTHQRLPQMDVWAAHGFVEVQAFAKEKWGRPVAPTYRGNTVIDQMWISQELVPFMHSVVTDESYFADHACLYATFKDLARPSPCRVWRQPLVIPWDDLKKPLPDVAPSDLDPMQHDFLPRLFAQFEKVADNHSLDTLGHRLLDQQKGRCQTTVAKTKCFPVAPVKRARPGEVEVTYLGEHFQHVQWCRQLRRLQSFHKAVAGTPTQQHKTLHISQLWIAIKRAPGFAKGFPAFWSTKAFAAPGTPAVLPKNPPGAKIAEAIFVSFRHEFERLERALIQARGQAAKQRRKENANVAFADVARPRALPVQTLARSVVAQVTEIDLSAKTVSYEPHTLACDQPVYGPSGLLELSDHVPGCLTVPDAANALDLADELTQHRLDGSAEDVARAFTALWEPMWNKHKDLPLQHWDAAIDRLKSTLPNVQHELTLPPITPSEWTQAVKAKKPRSATGPDGIARRDLLAMPPAMTAKLVDHINLLDQGVVPWHPCATTGLIALVEKRPNASKPQDFRPICVLSFLYRTWASIRARQCLAWLDTLAPPGQHGNRPGTSARHIWWRLAQQLELFQLEGTDCSGVITDVVKCFNTLPRTLIAFCARRLGLPGPFLHSWHHIITQLDRRFVISGHVSGSVHSVTGYPEGCALSVVAMSVLNVAMHGFVQQNQLSCRIISYVDNWEGFTTEPAEITAVAAAFQEFASLTDIALDTAKTETWSLTAPGRKALRDQGFKVALAARDLGGQMVYCKRPCVATIKARIAQHQDFWDWLGRSVAPTAMKMRLLHTVAWPRLLHGVSNHSLGAQHFQQMRISAMQALRWQKKGASSLVQFGLDRNPRSDPGFYSLWLAVKDFRELHEPQIAYPILNSLAVQTAPTAAQGPCKALLDRLHTLTWQWTGNGHVLDHEQLEWHLVDAPVQWVILRLRQAWAKYIGGVMSTRHTFGGLQGVDIHLSHENIHTFSAPAQGFLRVLRNGTSYTRDMLFQTGKVPNDKCPFCSAPDSIRHRHWECPHFEAIRATIDPEVVQWLKREPTCFQFRGWVVEDLCQQNFRRALFTIPDTLDKFEWPRDVIDPPLHLFTDGSCLRPETPGLRLGTWAVCVAQLPDFRFFPVAAGGIPQGFHTTLRAEICAAIAAFHIGIARGCTFTVWTDNETVYRRIRQFLLEACAIFPPKATNHDLWNRLLALCSLSKARGLQPQVVKVRSHQDTAVYPELVEQWVIAGNDAADTAASDAVQDLPGPVRHFWQAACARVDRARRMRNGLQQLITQAGFLATAAKKEVETKDDDEWQQQLDQPRLADPADLSLHPLPTECTLPPKYSLGAHASRLFEWLRTLVSGDDLQPMWLSSHHLLIHFQGTTGLMGYKFNQRTNKWDAVTDTGDDMPPFPKQANAFQAAVKCLAVGLGLPYKPVQRLPAGNAYRCWINCALIPMSQSTFRRIDLLMAERGAAGISNVNKTMRNWSDFCGALLP